MKRIGILGGTFDPIHNGHLSMATAAYEELGLDKLLVIPAGRPYFKGHITSYDVRCDMIRIALESIRTGRDDGHVAAGLDVELSTLESDQENPTYTYQTLDRLHRDHPESELFFICGTDVYRSIDTWKKPEEVMRLATFAVFARDRETAASISVSPDARCVILSAHIPDVSSTQIRDRISRNEPVDDLVPAGVAEYIGSHSLYRYEQIL